MLLLCVTEVEGVGDAERTTVRRSVRKKKNGLGACIVVGNIMRGLLSVQGE